MEKCILASKSICTISENALLYIFGRLEGWKLSLPIRLILAFILFLSFCVQLA